MLPHLMLFVVANHFLSRYAIPKEVSLEKGFIIDW